MTPRIGVLDQSPIISGHTPAQAVAETIALAALADRLGYHRYWLAEHHSVVALADPCPEILAARVAAGTRRIRVGTGGVLLPYYSPVKVWEGPHPPIAPDTQEEANAWIEYLFLLRRRAGLLERRMPNKRINLTRFAGYH